MHERTAYVTGSLLLLGRVGTVFFFPLTQRSYLYAIEHAEHFIYIENQFFVSSTAGPNVKNRVALAIFERA